MEREIYFAVHTNNNNQSMLSSVVATATKRLPRSNMRCMLPCLQVQSQGMCLKERAYSNASSSSSSRASAMERGNNPAFTKIIRISERFISPMNEIRIKEILDGVEEKVKKWPGLRSIETLVDIENPNRYVVVTEWENRNALTSWLKSDICRKSVDDLNKCLDRPPNYREFVKHEDDVFLL